MFNVIEVGINVCGEYTMGSFPTYKEAESYKESLIEEDRWCGCAGEYEYYITESHNH